MLQLGQPGQNGWGTVMATDTAFVIGCLALLGARIPQSLRIFMLSLAIVDDIGAILVVSIGYGSRIHWEILALSAIGVVIVRVMTLLGVRSITLYFLIGGIIWLIIDASGVHATITGIILGLMTPTVKWVTDKHLHTILDSVGVMPEAHHKKKPRITEWHYEQRRLQHVKHYHQSSDWKRCYTHGLDSLLCHFLLLLMLEY
ncbi:Na+/H+ antiporter NhaA [Spartinivicinus ruber]|uniref:Na+/H+ antiporter NhaA n=1 Tax=Spartinivicinus ruber TaxID=2683272 RepID=UPI001CA39A51|nr:Na+/H+ antiporter NhaA [Spartinivicinus ruber]